MIAVISDIHANLEALEAVLAEIRRERIGTIVCLGDIVGYNADPSECIRRLRNAEAVCIAGNHDRAVTGQITTEGFNPLAARAVDWTRDRLTPDELNWLAALPLKTVIDDRLVAVHGALHPDVGCELVRLNTDEKRLLSFQALAAHPSGVRICAFGHTHRIGVYEMRDGAVTAHEDRTVRLRDDSFYLVNPGTVGQPRTSDRRPSYLVLDPDAGTIGLRRVRYDASKALTKTRKAGLAPRFSRLPEPIRTPLRRVYKAIVG
ncbi:putative phosphodiesterase [Skermanella aerolata]|uniref:metallophosphoesterase family protein n=1 Tax=Skermanella aerolata TaxID=393310 RepID=UPI003D24F5C9